MTSKIFLTTSGSCDTADAFLSISDSRPDRPLQLRRNPMLAKYWAQVVLHS